MQETTTVSRLVLAETRLPAHLAKWTLRAVVLLGVSLAQAGQATAAPVVFEVSGGNPDDDGVALSGTVTIDTATGKVLSADVTATHVLYDGSFTEFVFDEVESVHQTVSRGRRPVAVTTISIGEGFGNGIGLVLAVQESTLVGYKGSPLYSLDINDLGSCIEFPGTPYGAVEIALYGSLEPN